MKIRFAALFLALLVVAAPVAAPGAPPKADHLVMLVFDSMRPDYIDRFKLANFRRLRRIAREHVNGYVGHMGAETVVSHPVLATGRLPKDLPWQDEAYIDLRGILGEKGIVYATGGLKPEQFRALQATLPSETFLPGRVKKVHGGRVFSVAQKLYTAYTFGTPAADVVITMKKDGTDCVPFGENVPVYVAGNPRYRVDCTKAYGTETSFYPLDGAKSVPGDDPEHVGGDPWVADIGLEIMRKETDWSVLLLSFAGIDKMSHMTAEHDGPRPNGFKTPYTLEGIAKLADEQLGRILDELEARKLMDRTTIVVTADHGGQPNDYYFGVAKTGKVGVRDGAAAEIVSPWLHRLRSLARVKEIFADSAIRVWLEGTDTENVERAVGALNEISGVVEVYQLSRDQNGAHAYVRRHSRVDAQPTAYRRWARAHHQELVDSMATAGAPDLIALLADGVGFDLLGDHGGAQERVQRIPYFLKGPGISPGRSHAPARLADVARLISPSLGL